MSATVDERAGVILVRVWTEPDGGTRARITATDDLTTGDETVTAAAGVEEILAVVRAWLERFARLSEN